MLPRLWLKCGLPVAPCPVVKRSRSDGSHIPVHNMLKCLKTRGRCNWGGDMNKRDVVGSLATIVTKIKRVQKGLYYVTPVGWFPRTNEQYVGMNRDPRKYKYLWGLIRLCVCCVHCFEHLYVETFHS